jgi:UDP-N-acetylglucosamine 2-epimerase (non-hydrolysing)
LPPVFFEEDDLRLLARRTHPVSMVPSGATPLRIALVFGTRPEAIKLAPLVKRFQANPERFACTTIVTAQHREMLDQVLDLFSIRPDYDLDILRPRQSLAQITAAAITGLDAVLASTQPDFVLVQGDTSTTFIGALAAFYHKIRVAHVEAGLRTRQKYYPYPEEMNRALTGVLADAHFAPTALAHDNLVSEGVPADRIWVTGNTGIDALNDVLEWQQECAHPVLRRIMAEKRRMILVTSHRRENHGKPQERICSALLRLAREFPDIAIVFPVHLSPAVRDTVLPQLREQEQITLLDPIDYFETIHFMKAAYLILTDSGGIQEEAPSLGKPVLVLRETTERPEGVDAGSVRLVGTESGAIFDAAAQLLTDSVAYGNMTEAINPYGDGRASDRIIQALEFMTGRAENPAPFASPVRIRTVSTSREPS